MDERQNLEREDEYGIEDFFLSEVDSWFSADIACCDKCIDDFLKTWPFAYSADNARFQNQQMDLELFYSGSRLRDAYTEKEFFKFVRLVSCPRCDEELTSGFYPYEFPFDPIEDFELFINELADLSKKSPFLLIKHPFATQVFEAIEELYKDTSTTTVSTNLYKARVKSQVSVVKASEFDITPKQYASEGRYNHAGLPAFYLGSDMETCYQELRKKDSYIAELVVEKEIRILDLTATYENHNKHSDLLDTLVYSSLISAKQDETGSFRPQYIFSRFIADCAKYVGFDAIKYPSTRTNIDNFNIVLLDNNLCINNLIKLSKIYSYAGADNCYEVEPSS